MTVTADASGHSGAHMVERDYPHLASSNVADVVRWMAPDLTVNPVDGFIPSALMRSKAT
jgi:hypothetical protein